MKRFCVQLPCLVLLVLQWSGSNTFCTVYHVESDPSLLRKNYTLYFLIILWFSGAPTSPDNDPGTYMEMPCPKTWCPFCVVTLISSLVFCQEYYFIEGNKTICNTKNSKTCVHLHVHVQMKKDEKAMEYMNMIS